MPTNLSFLPAPRRAAYPQGSFTLADDRLIVLDASVPQELLGAGWRLKAALQKQAGLTWSLNASTAAPEALVGVTLRVAPEREPHPQGYRLHVTPQGVEIEGHDPAGVFYGVCTFIQVLQQVGRELPLLEVQDWPDISARGVMLDISRDRVYRMDTLYELVDRLAGWKINQLQLYTEHTFAYQDHQQVWQKASPMTGRRNPGAGRILPGALHRTRAQPELVWSPGPLADPSSATRAGRDARRDRHAVGRTCTAFLAGARTPRQPALHPRPV